MLGLRVAARDGLRHERRDVGDLLRAQLVAEGRHPAPAVRHLRRHALEVGDAREVGDRRCPLCPRSVAAGAVRREDGLAGRGVALGGLLAALAAVLCPAPPPALGGPIVPSSPNSQSCRRARSPGRLFPWERKTTYCLPSCLEDRGGVVRPGPGLEVPGRVPSRASYASSSPLLRPTKTRLPFVVWCPSSRLGNSFCHLRLAARASIAVKVPVDSVQAAPAITPPM